MRITDERKGLALTKLCTSTIRAVAQGVIGVAFIQALLAGRDRTLLMKFEQADRL